MKLTNNKRSKLQKLQAKIKPWQQTEHEEVQAALSKADGNKSLAASLLGIGKQALYRKLKPLDR